MNGVSSFNFERFQKDNEERLAQTQGSWLQEENTPPISFKDELPFKAFLQIGAHPSLFLNFGSDDQNRPIFNHFLQFLKEVQTKQEDYTFLKKNKSGLDQFIKEIDSLYEKPTVETLKKKLETQKAVFIPFEKEGHTILLRIEKGVGIEIFDSCLPEKVVCSNQKKNLLSGELEFTFQTPCKTVLIPSQKDKFLEDPFFSILIDGLSNRHISKNDFISALEVQLSGKREVENLGEGSYKKPVQSHKKSLIKSLGFAFQSALIGKDKSFDDKEGVKAFKILMFYFQMNTLISSWKAVSETDPEKLDFFEDQVANVARSAEKLRLKGFIQENDLNDVMITIIDIEKQIRSQKQRGEKEPSFRKVVIEDSLNQGKVFDLKLKEKSLLSQNQKGRVRPHPINPDELLKPFRPLKKETLLSQLEGIRRIKEGIIRDEVYACFENFMKGFPSVKDPVWIIEEKDDRLKIIRALEEIIFDLRGHSVRPLINLMCYQILAVIDHLARQDDNVPFDPKSKTFIGPFLKEIRSSGFFLEAPFQIKLNEVLEYFLGEEEAKESVHLLKDKDREGFNLKYKEYQRSSLFGITDYYYFCLSDKLKDSWIPYEKKDATYALYEKLHQKGVTFKKEESLLFNMTYLMSEKSNLLPESFSALQRATLTANKRPSLRSSNNSSEPIRILLNENDEPHFNEENRGKELFKLKNPNYSDSFCSVEHQESHLQNYMMGVNYYAQHLRDKHLIASNPYEEAVRAVTYCLNHMETLISETIQNSIQRTLLRMNRLSSQIKAVDFHKTLEEFIKKGVIHFKGSQKIKEALFFVQLATIIAPFLEGEIKASFIKNLRNFFLKNLLPLLRDQGQSGLSLLDPLLEFYSQSNDLHQGSIASSPLFVVDFILYTILEGQAEEEEKRVPLSLNAVFLKRFGEWFISQESIENVSKSLNEVTQILGIEGERVWEKKERSYESTDLIFDFEKGKLFNKKKEEIRSLPKSIKNDPLYKKVMGGDVEKTTTEYEGAFQVITQKGRSLRFSKTLSTLKIEALIENEWHELLVDSAPFASHYPTRLKEFMVQNDKFQNSKEEESHFYWRSGDKIRVFEKNEKKVTLTLLPSETKVYLEENNRYLETKENFNALNVLVSLEPNPRYIEALCDAEKTIKEVNLPRCGLVFEVKERNLYSKQYEGFFVVHKMEVEGINPSLSYVVLAHKTGQKKLLFQENGKIVTLSLVNNELKADTVFDNLFLAKCHFQRARWKEGEEALRRIRGIQAFDKKDLEAFEGLKDQLFKSQHPIGLAFWLKLVVQVEMNRLKYRASSSIEEISFRDLFLKYEMYLRLKGNMGAFAPTPLEEIRFLEFLKRTPLIENEITKKGTQILLNDFIENRIAFLEGKKVPQKRVFFSLETIHIPNFFFLEHETVSRHFQRPETNGFKLDEKVYFLRHTSDFSTYFVDYYKIAKEGTEEERKHLLKMIALNSVRKEHVEALFLASLLKKVCQKPTAFPTLEEIRDSFKKKNEYKTKKDASFLERVHNSFFGPEAVYKRLLSPLCIGKLQALFLLAKMCHKGVRGGFSNLFAIFQWKYLNLFNKKINKILFKETKEKLPIRPFTPQHLSNLEEEKTLLSARKTALLSFLNHVSNGSFQKQVCLIGMRKTLGFEEMKTLFLNSSFDEFLQKTALSRVDAIIFLEGLADYFVRLTRVQALEKGISFEEKERTFQKADRIQTLFEASQGVVYWQKQVEKIREIFKALEEEKKRDVSVKIDTGQGKTALMIPDLALRYAGEKLVVLMWPESSELRNSLDIQKTFEKTVAIPVDRFKFDRHSSYTLDSYKLFYEELKSHLEKGVPLNLRKESIQSLQLHHQMLLDEFSETNREKLEMITLILRFFRTKCVAIIDEEHMNFRSNEQLVYTNGKKRELTSLDIDVAETLFRALGENDLAELIHHKENQQHHLENYKEAIKPKLIQKMSRHFKVNESDFSQFMSATKIPEWVETHRLKKELCLMKGYITLLLEPILKNSVDKNYGLSQKHLEKHPYAIPFLGVNTPKENEMGPSEFKVPEKTIGATYLTYLHKGLNLSQVTEMLKLLKKEVELQLQYQNLAESRSHQFYLSLFKEGEKVPSILELKSKEDVEPLFESLSKNEELIYAFIRRIALKKLFIYQESFMSNSQNMRTQFSQTLSFSATPLPKEAHAKETHLIEEKRVFENGKERIAHLKNTLDSFDSNTSVLPFVKESLRNNPKIRMIIDVGALFKGKTNEEIAKSLLPSLQEGDKGVVFSNKNEALEILSKETKTTYPFNQEREGHLDYLDAMRSYGTDIKQVKDAVGLLLVEGKNTFSEVVQAIGRLRDIENDQRALISIEKTLERKLFHEGDSKEIKLQKLLEHLLENQKVYDQKTNFDGKKQQLANEAHQMLLDKLLGLDPLNPKFDESVSLDSAISLFKKVRSHFVFQDLFDPVRYGASPTKEKSLKVLEREKTRRLKEADTLKGLTQQEKKRLKEELESYSFESLLLEEDIEIANYSLDLQIEAEQEIEQQQEIEQEVQKRDRLIQEKTPWGHPEKLDIFSEGWEKPSRVFGWPLLNKIKALALSCIRQVKEFFKVTHKTPPFRAFVIGATQGLLTTLFIATLIMVFPIVFPIASFWSVYQLKKLNVYKNKSSEVPLRYDCPFYRVRDVLGAKLFPETACSKKFFSENLLVTNNFWQLKTQKENQKSHVLFDYDEKPLYSVLVVQDVERVKVILIDQNDTEFFRKKLLKDREKGTNSSKRRVGIYDLTLGQIVDEGVNKLSVEENQEFKSLIVQAKLISSEMNRYSKEEEELIKKSFSSKEVIALFEEEVISLKESKKFYEDSVIGRIFKAAKEKVS
jgi:hypothetical protein